MLVFSNFTKLNTEKIFKAKQISREKTEDVFSWRGEHESAHTSAQYQAITL